MPSVTLRSVTKRFEDRVALDQIDLEVKSGEYMVLLGPTGAGKTTLLRVVSGLVEPDDGSVLINGEDITGNPTEERGVTYMSQTYSLFPHLQVWDNVLFSPSVRGIPASDSNRLGREMLLLVGLLDRHDAYPRELSGGMQQRTALARALTAGTQVLLLDEPLRALDARLRIELRLSIRRLCKDLGITAIHVTHDQEEALLVADRIAILRHGKIEQIGTSEQVYMKPSNPFVAQFLGEANFFSGRVEKVTPDTAFIRIKEKLWQAPTNSLAAGQDVILAVKTENMDIVRNLSDKPNSFKAVVTRLLFLGRFIGLEMKSEVSKYPIKAKLKLKDVNGINEGEEVNVAFDSFNSMTFLMPPSGLGRELEVE